MSRKLLAALLLMVAGAALAVAESKEAERLGECARTLREIFNIPDAIPQELIDKAECVGVIPSTKKFALGLGGRYGKGAVVCRTDGGRGPWGPPLMIGIGGGSFGLQIGGQAADYVFLIMNPRGIDHLLKSRFTLGADAAVAAGPKGRTAEAGTDALMHAEILTYSRTRGLFAGISLEGAVISQDKDANRSVYGERVTPRDLLLRPGQPIPAVGRSLVAALNEISPHNASGR